MIVGGRLFEALYWVQNYQACSISEEKLFPTYKPVFPLQQQSILRNSKLKSIRDDIGELDWTSRHCYRESETKFLKR